MKVALIYPPDRNFPGNPYASLPTLASCLESQGHAATLHDVNLEVFLSFTQDARLLRWYERLADRMTSLGEKDSLAPAEAAEYDGLVRRLSIPVDSLARAPQALEVMNHAAGFYDPGRFNRAFDDLRAALQFYFGDNPLDNAQTAGVPDRLFELLEAPLTDPVSEALTQGILDDILAQKPDLVGISIPFMVSYWEAMKLMRLLKTRAPGLPIVVGGALVENHEPIFVGDPRLFSLYDFVIAGDGDRALPRLATALEKGTSLGEVPNLYVPDAQGKAAFTFGEAVRNLNALPAPDFTGLPLDRYPVPETGATFQTSRGCYYGRCTFCSESFRDNYRLRKPEKVVEDMVRVYQTTGITHFYFWDSLCPPRTLKHVAEQVKIRGLPFTWFAETKMEKVYLPPEFMQTLFDGGCRFLQFGFESASQRVLDLIDKDNHLPEVEQVLTNMEQAGIKASLTWFIGFPTETAAEARLTYDTIRRLGSRVTISAYSGVYHLLPDQPLFHQQDRFGIRITQNEHGGYVYTYNDGSAPYDRMELHQGYEARGDGKLLHHGAYLLYAHRVPENLNGLTGIHRAGFLARHVGDLRKATVQRTGAVVIRPFPRDTAQDIRQPPRPFKMVYQRISRQTFRLRGREIQALEAAGAPIHAAALAERLQVGWPEMEDILTKLSNRGLLRFLNAEERIEIDPAAVPGTQMSWLPAPKQTVAV